MDVFCIALAFSKGKFRNERKNYSKREENLRFFEKKNLKREIVCELENGKILWNQEIIGEMRKIEKNKKGRCIIVYSCK